MKDEIAVDADDPHATAVAFLRRGVELLAAG